MLRRAAHRGPLGLGGALAALILPPLAGLLGAGCVIHTAPRAPRFDDLGCPPGAEAKESEFPPGVRRAWCERPGPDGPVRHGPATTWHKGGGVASQGAFVDDLEEGLWTWWYPSGAKSQEGHFKAGRPHGRWRAWDEDGAFGYVLDYDEGALRCGDHPLQTACPPGEAPAPAPHEATPRPAAPPPAGPAPER